MAALKWKVVLKSVLTIAMALSVTVDGTFLMLQ